MALPGISLWKRAATFATLVLGGCAFLGPDETHYDILRDPHAAQSATIRRWSAVDAESGATLGEGCFVHRLRPFYRVRFPARPGQVVEVTWRFEWVSQPYDKVNPSNPTDAEWCAMHKEPPTRTSGIDSPACWTSSGGDRIEPSCTDETLAAASLLGFEHLPADARKLPQCRFEGDGYSVTFRVNSLGLYCYVSSGSSRLIGFETVGGDG